MANSIFRTNKKTFSEVKVGDKLYYSSLNMEHIHSTIVTEIKLILDGEHVPEFCNQVISTSDGFEVTMSKYLMGIHDCYVYAHKHPENLICVGTSAQTVASYILKEVDEKIKVLESYKDRFVNNLLDEYEATNN